MHRNLLFIVAGSLLVSCCSKPTQVTIELSVSGVADSARVLLIKNEGQLGKFIEKGFFKDGKMTFAYTPDSLDQFPLDFSIYGDSLIVGRVDIYASLGTTKVNGSGNYAPKWRVKNSTPEQKELNKLLDAIQVVSEPYYEANEEELRLKIEGDKAGSDSVGAIKQQAFETKLSAEVDYLQTLKTFNRATIDELKDVALFGIKYRNFLTPRLEDLRTILNNLTPEQQNSPIGEEIKSILYPPKQVAIGDMLPNDILYDTAGNSHKMSDYAGKYIILDFWSSGCGPCIMAGPEIKEVQEKYKDKLTIISITTDDEATWKDASAQHNVTWTNLSDYKGRNAGFCAQFSFLGIPYFMIADPSGKIIGDWIGYSKGMISEQVEAVLR